MMLFGNSGESQLFFGLYKNRTRSGHETAALKMVGFSI